MAAKHFSWDLKGQGLSVCLVTKIVYMGRVPPSGLWPLSVKSILYQAIYIPFLCLKVLGAKWLLEYYYKELLQKIIVRLVCTLLLWHKTLKYTGIWLFWDGAAWDNPKRGTVA